MANMPDVNKKFLGVQLPIVLWARVKKKADMFGDSMNSVVVRELTMAMRDVELEEKDYEIIKDEWMKNVKKRGNKNA